MRLHLTIVTLGLTAIAVPGEARNVESSDAPIITLVQAFSDARSHFDPKALDALLTPDYVEVSPRGEIDRRQAVLGFYAADKATPVPPMSLATQDVRRYGDTAIVIGSVDYTIPTPTGGTVKRTARVTYVERRVGTRWLMASAQYTGVQSTKTGAIALSFPEIASISRMHAPSCWPFVFGNADSLGGVHEPSLFRR